MAKSHKPRPNAGPPDLLSPLLEAIRQQMLDAMSAEVPRLAEDFAAGVRAPFEASFQALQDVQKLQQEALQSFVSRVVEQFTALVSSVESQLASFAARIEYLENELAELRQQKVN